jgi:hypothetical protein
MCADSTAPTTVAGDDSATDLAARAHRKGRSAQRPLEAPRVGLATVRTIPLRGNAVGPHPP